MAEERATPNPYGGDYVWPENLYREMRDMAAISFLVYQFGYIVDAARTAKKNGDTFIGIEVDDEHHLSNAEVDDGCMNRTFTPAEVLKILDDNSEALSRKSDFRGQSLEGIKSALAKLQARVDEASGGLERPLTLSEFDDKHQKKECVYGITKDSINKRISIVFRGSDELAVKSNWLTNFSINKKEVDVPKLLEGKIKDLDFHTGFHNYVFNETVDETDAAGTTKFDDIMTDLKSLLDKFPDYKIYVCGHSLGAALSTIAAFYLACDPDLPKPISCINFASPRVGGESFLHGVNYLEKTKQLRMLRSVNENDNVTTLPSIGYNHVGIQVTTYAKRFYRRPYKPDIDYMNPTADWWSKIKQSWSNNILTNLNLGYDHGAYISRIELVENHLEKTSLNELYADEDLVGFKLQDL